MDEPLETRLRKIEDQLAIYQVIAAYGPAVDGLSAPGLAPLWTEDGVYDAGGKAPYESRDAVVTLLEQEPHATYVASGCGHVSSLPVVSVDGDTAVATNHSRVYQHDGEQWRVVRASANRWELVRTGEGWQVKRRTNRPLDGSAAPRELLAAAFDASTDH